MKTILVNIYHGKRLLGTRDCEFISIQHQTARIRDYAADEDQVGLYDIRTGQRTNRRRGFTFTVDPDNIFHFLPAHRQAAKTNKPKSRPKAVWYRFRATLSNGKVVTIRATSEEKAVAIAKVKSGDEPRSMSKVDPLRPRFSL